MYFIDTNISSNCFTHRRPKAVVSMKYYVRRFTACVVCYIGCIVMYIMNTGVENANPSNWSHWAALIYHCLAQFYVSNFIYISASLEKKLKRFKDTGKVR